MSEKKESKYSNIQLPIAFVDRYIEPLVQDKTLGYSSRASVVKAGVRALHGLSNQDHQELLLFLVKTFIASGLSIEIPDHLEKELKELIEKEGL